MILEGRAREIVVEEFVIVANVFLDDLDESLLDERVALVDLARQVKSSAQLLPNVFVTLGVKQVDHQLVDLLDKGGGLHHC